MENKIYNNVTELIGHTPLVRLNKIVKPGSAEVIAKVESFNPGGSIKDRACFSMIQAAEEKGILKEGATIIEPTTGNTGIGLAMICAVKGYRCILTMPENLSLERIYIVRSYGAEVVLTPAKDGVEGAIRKAEQLNKTIKDSFIPLQFNSPANPEAHRQTTALEILEGCQRQLDAFVAGVGTGGTITGTGEVLKQELPDLRVVAVEPQKSAVLSGQRPGPHKIQGIGAGFVPEILNRGLIDQIIAVDDKEAYEMSRRLSKEEGLLVGISSGANVLAALKVAEELGEGKRVVVILCDTGERYFSLEQYFQA